MGSYTFYVLMTSPLCYIIFFFAIADDLKLYYPIKRTNDILTLLRDLNVLNMWCIENEMQLNVKSVTFEEGHRSPDFYGALLAEATEAQLEEG